MRTLYYCFEVAGIRGLGVISQLGLGMPSPKRRCNDIMVSNVGTPWYATFALPMLLKG